MVRIIQPLVTEAEETALHQILAYLEEEAKEYKSLRPEERKGHIYRAVLTLRAVASLNRPLFELGKTVSTPGAVKAIDTAGENARDFLRRHEFGDWGDVGFEDWESNNQALIDWTRLFSVYRTRLDERIWVITEADRSVTTLLLPEEY